MHLPPIVMRSTVRFAAVAALVAIAGCKDAEDPVVATKLALATTPAASVRNRVPLAPQPAIKLTDDRGRGASTAGIVVSATVTGAAGTLIGNTTATTNSSGVATFTD